jgi:hypothetical protein
MRRYKELLKPETLRSLLSYDPESGDFKWIEKRFNGADSGQSAGSINRYGYRRICVFGSYYTAHRLAWLLHYGVEPKGSLDHINGVRSDNRIANLREATNSQNGYNMSLSSASKSGVKGVRFYCRAGRKDKWSARIMVQGESIFLGLFDTLEEAKSARLCAAEKYHGEFARP